MSTAAGSSSRMSGFRSIRSIRIGKRIGSIRRCSSADAELPPKEATIDEWHHWVHADHANFAKPLKVFLGEKYQAQVAKFNAWKTAQINAAQKKKDGSVEQARKLDFNDYLGQLEAADAQTSRIHSVFRWRHKSGEAFERATREATNIKAWKQDDHVAEWSKAKIAAYNGHLSGKILIPQPFATLRNMYEAESGFAISKYLVIEIVVGLVLVVIFSQLARKMERGDAAAREAVELARNVPGVHSRPDCAAVAGRSPRGRHRPPRAWARIWRAVCGARPSGR